MGETSNPDVCHRSVVGHASQCEVTHTSTRAGINIPIPWTLTTTDEGLSLSRSVIATDIPTFCQVCVISLAKANSTLNPLQAIFIKWSTRNIIMPGRTSPEKKDQRWPVLFLTVSEKYARI